MNLWSLIYVQTHLHVLHTCMLPDVDIFVWHRQTQIAISMPHFFTPVSNAREILIDAKTTKQNRKHIFCAALLVFAIETTPPLCRSLWHSEVYGDELRRSPIKTQLEYDPQGNNTLRFWPPDRSKSPNMTVFYSHCYQCGYSSDKVDDIH